MDRTKTATRMPVSSVEPDKVNVNRILQRKRSSSRTQNNYRPIPIPQETAVTTSNSKSTAKNGTIQGLPQLQQHVYIVKLVPLEPSGTGNDLLKILSVPVHPDTLKIGRQNGPKVPNKITDGYFDSRVLSRTHAELYVKDNLLYIRDLKSSNGTYVNDEKLVPLQEYQLKLDDKIDLGTTLENQLTHKKITCRVAELRLVSLDEYETIVNTSITPLESDKMALFNGALDALIFGDVIDEQDDPVIEAMLRDLTDQELDLPSLKQTEPPKDIVESLNIKSTSRVEDVIRKLTIVINNENLQHQKLSSISRFLSDYTRAIPKENSSNGEASSLIEELTKKHALEEKKLREEEQKWRTKTQEAESSTKRLQIENTELREELESTKRMLHDLQTRMEELEAINRSAEPAVVEDPNMVSNEAKPAEVKEEADGESVDDHVEENVNQKLEEEPLTEKHVKKNVEEPLAEAVVDSSTQSSQEVAIAHHNSYLLPSVVAIIAIAWMLLLTFFYEDIMRLKSMYI